MKRYKKEISNHKDSLKVIYNKVNTAKTALRDRTIRIKRDARNNSFRLIRKLESGEKLESNEIEKAMRRELLD